jgi:hypothetical protein
VRGADAHMGFIKATVEVHLSMREYGLEHAVVFAQMAERVAVGEPVIRSVPEPPGPMPRRRRPGAIPAIDWACAATANGWRGQMGTIAVPSPIRRVRAAAAAIIVSASGPVAAVMSQAVDSSSDSARSISCSVPATSP